MKHTTAVLALGLFGAALAHSQVTLNTTPSRSAGTPLPNPESSFPNLVEGKELFSPWGIALDTSSSPPIVYVSDAGNNRVLGWKNATGFTNGQPADIVIGQQDFYATDPQGPGHKFSVGLWAPSGLAVNSSGDLYVVDTNNNRILRFRTPFQHISGTPGVLTTAPDLYIGQPSLSSRNANYTGQFSAQGLSFKSNYPANITFDSSGNLWVCDVGNYRVLRFPSSSLNATGGSISADIVIGQQSMTTVSGNIPSGATGLQNTNQFATLGGIGFDPQGRLYVGDTQGNSLGAGRVLVFANPAASPNSANADRLMGVFPPGTQNLSPTTIGATAFGDPASIFFIPDNTGNAYVGVMDSLLNRATIFAPYPSWSTSGPPPAVPPGGVLGQGLNFTTYGPNGNTTSTVTTPPASPSVFFGAVATAYLNSTQELFVADTLNNRVIVMPYQPNPGNPVAFGGATRVLGQARFDQFSINYIEGKEFQFSSGAGIALDTTTSTPHLYVADTVNHRVLGFKDARLIAPNLHADIVIGQPDFGSALCNYPTGDTTRPSRTNLCGPVGLAVDPQGNLYVADSGNGRVLRFPSPFSYTGTGPEPADLVLGQQDFTTQVLDPTASTMHTPYGLAFSGTNGLLVSDLFFNRVLYFKFSANNTFAAGTDNGKAASKVYGQQDFFGINSGNGFNQLAGPHHISADTSGRLYVADTGNNRILIFDDPNSASTPTGGDSAPVALTQGINQPLSVYVNPNTGEVWVANSGQGAIVRYPIYDTLSQNQASLSTIQDIAQDPGQPSGAIQYAPIATVQDQFGDLFVADTGNRIITYYQNLSVVNGASFLSYRLLAPGTIATIFPAKGGSASQFGSKTDQFSNLPLPTSLADVQVTVNGTNAPLFFSSPGQINFVIPFNAPDHGTAEVDVIQSSTKQILGTTVINMSSVSPGIFQCPASTASLRQACILNEDNTVNSFTNQALRGHVIQIFGTGQGVVPNAPPDGQASSGTVPASVSPRLLINGQYPEQYPTQPGDPANGQFITYFGLAPGLVGVWQLNIQIPMGVAPGQNVQIEVNLNNIFDTDVNSGFHMSMAVK